MSTFGKSHGIKFNPSKCELIILNKDKQRSIYENTRDNMDGPVTINDIEISEVDQIKYPGLIFKK